jgi:hypothetical protein
MLKNISILVGFLAVILSGNTKLQAASFFPLIPYLDPQQPQYYYQMADTCGFNLLFAQDTLWRYGADSVKYNNQS